MLLFRSEEHVERWCRTWKQPRGGVLSREQGWGLAQAWFAEGLRSDWRRKTSEEAQTLFTQLGLASPFWRLTT